MSKSLKNTKQSTSDNQIPEVKTSVSMAQRKSPTRKLLVILLIIVIVLLWIFKNPKIFLAGVVNNKPITTWQLNDELQKRFGSRMLDQMIDEMLITQQAQKEGVTVTDSEIENKVTALQNQAGGKEALDQLLLRQGVSIDDFKLQFKLQLLVDKILGKTVIISQGDVENYLEKNKSSMSATDSATQIRIATESVRQQKMTEAFQKWYSDLKSKANIYKFF